jgi:hypothetical protein
MYLVNNYVIVSRVEHSFSTKTSCAEEKYLRISKLWKCLCNAKAVECQRQLTYNMAQGGDMGFAQRLCYENGVGHSLGKCLVGRSLGKRLWSCYFNAPQTVFISCLVYRRTASGLTSHKSNYRHYGSNFSPFPLPTIVLRCRVERKNCASFDIKRIRLLIFYE